jgi:uncharacterized protein
MSRFSGLRQCLLALCLLLAGCWVQAQALLPVPTLAGHVLDSSGALSAKQVSQIEQQLAALEQRSGTQMAVLLVPSTAPEDIFSYANRVANVWKIGRKDVGDGVLIVVAVQDRRMRIEVAKSLEGAIPDLAAKQIIERDMVPAFKRGDYAGGLGQAIDSLGRRVALEGLPVPTAAARQDVSRNSFNVGDNWSFLLLGLFLVSQVLRRSLGRGLGAVLTGLVGAGLAYAFSASLLLALGVGVLALAWGFFSGLASKGLNFTTNSGMGRGRGGFGGRGSGGGGGFRSGGGGDFGGGGASGRW